MSTLSAFAPNAPVTTSGTKGSDVYTATGVGDPRVALSVLLTRGVAHEAVRDGVRAILNSSVDNASTLIEDAFLLAFQTRDVRGGKGERDASEEVFKALLTDYRTAALTLDLIDLLPEYGCWKDVFSLWDPQTRERILDVAEAQFKADEATVAEGGEKGISLLAKWAPREDRGKEMARALADRLFTARPGEPAQFSTIMKHYRKRVAALNKRLQTVETKMCAKTWAEIEPGKVPGRAGKKYVRAFLNEVVAKKGKYVAPDTLRHPDDPDRMKCRENFQAYNAKTATGEIKAKGSDTVFPHEVIKKVYKSLGRSSGYDDYGYDYSCREVSSALTEDEKNHLRGVWRAMVEAARAGGGLGRSLAMCDFSGSMQMAGKQGDLPYWVSMAMGLLISECTTEEFKNKVLTFDSTPTFHEYPEGDVFDKIKSLRENPRVGQGTSTDFQKAMDLVLATLKKNRTLPGQEPENLIVITDMNWDQAASSAQYGAYTGNSYRHHVKTSPWQTHVEMIRESFKRAGEDLHGEGNGWKMPRIVIWNVAATSADFHAKADTEGVVMLAGWSPSLFKVLQEKGVVIQTPYMALRAQLDDPRYDRVRERVRAFLSS